MKRTSTFLLSSLLVIGLTANAATPTIDGTFDGEGIWGSPIGTADGVTGWSGTNSKKLYMTSDAGYFYFCAEITASDWMSWAFILNTKTGGATNDSWSRQVNYNHSNKPDFTFRGTFGGYSEYHSWNGSSWDGMGISQASTEFAESIAGSDQNGFVEIRVARSFVGVASLGDMQFYITGDNNDHGSFDAVPNDNNAAGWNPPTSTTTLSQYVAGLVLPVELKEFSGELKNNNVNLTWKTATESNLSHFEIEQSTDARNWTKAGTVAGLNSANGAIYNHSLRNISANFLLYRLKIVDNNGRFSYSNLVTIKTKGKSNIEIIGNPSKDMVKIAVHQTDAARFTAELVTINGKRISQTIYQHAGGSSVISINIPTVAAGMYILKVSSATTKETFKVMIK